MQDLYEAYKDDKRVAIFLVYVNEAHPSRTLKKAPTSAPAPPKRKGPGGIGKHEKIADRIIAAASCMEGLKLTLPILIDSMEGVAEKAYRGRPAATAVVDLDGKVAFYSSGPGGSRPKEAEKVIVRLLAQGGFPTTAPTTRPSANQPPAPKGK